MNISVPANRLHLPSFYFQLLKSQYLQAPINSDEF